MTPIPFFNPTAYGQPNFNTTVPASAHAETSANGEMFNLVTLADLTLYKNPKDVAEAAKRLLEKTDLVTDEKLRTSVRLALAQASAEPEKFPEIRARHFKQISQRFTEIADEARKNKNYRAALNAAQIAAKADPRNLRARLILAAIVDAYGNDTATAIKLMHAGLKFIDLDAPVTAAYFSKYFELLSAMQQDNVAADQAQKILKNKNVPAETRKLVALAGAFALYNRGDYAEALDLVARERLDDSVQGCILKARCIFASGNTEAAVELLEKSIAEFPADKREPIFNQLSKFFSERGNFQAVLDVAKRQLEENPDVLGPHLRQLFAYDKLGDKDAFSAELESIFTQFSMSQGALVALANFSAEQGLPEIAQRCLITAQERHFEPALFAAALIEALVVANRPAAAIDVYVQATSVDPKIFDEFDTVIPVVLASAYAEVAAKESDPQKAEAMRAHSELLLNQFLENNAVRPENELAAVRHFRRIGRLDIAGKIATAALKKFPWHSQLRADWISIQLATPGALAQLNLPAEIRVLAEMRRPDPSIWKEILAWLDAAKPVNTISAGGGWGSAPETNGISQKDAATLLAIVEPLAR